MRYNEYHIALDKLRICYVGGPDDLTTLENTILRGSREYWRL